MSLPDQQRIQRTINILFALCFMSGGKSIKTLGIDNSYSDPILFCEMKNPQSNIPVHYNHGIQLCNKNVDGELILGA